MGQPQMALFTLCYSQCCLQLTARSRLEQSISTITKQPHVLLALEAWKRICQGCLYLLLSLNMHYCQTLMYTQQVHADNAGCPMQLGSGTHSDLWEC